MMTQKENQAASDFANELQDKVIAIRLNISRFGRSRTFDQRQKAATAEAVGADEHNVRGGTKLYDQQDPWIKGISSAAGAFYQYWIDHTVYYPERGVRLLKCENLDQFQADFAEMQRELDRACQEADDHYDEIMDSARAALTKTTKDGEVRSAFDAANYPVTFKDSIRVRWNTHTFKPDERLLTMAPETYQREQQRVRQEFEMAIARFNDEVRTELQKMIAALMAKLNPENGKKVKWTEAAATNLREFFERFRSVNISNDTELEALINEAESALGSTTMQQLKRSPAKQRQIASAFTDIKEQLDSLVVAAPERAIDFDDLED